jgi:hypothetical protein
MNFTDLSWLMFCKKNDDEWQPLNERSELSGWKYASSHRILPYNLPVCKWHYSNYNCWVKGVD